MQRTVVLDLTLSLDTNAYASGDLLADTQELADAVQADDYGAVIATMIVIDKDDQGAALDVYILDKNVSFGTENSAPSISDTNAANIMGRIQVGTGDYYDLGGCKVAHITVTGGLPIKPANGARSIYVAAVNGTGTPTYTASGIVLRFGTLQD